MAMPSISASSPANNKPAGFQSVYAMDATSSKWQTLGVISNGELKFTGYSTPDSLARNKSVGSVGFTAKCQMKQTSLTELELIDSICDGTNAFLFKLSDAEAIPTGGSTATTGWVKVTAAQVCPKWKLVADGEPDKSRYIELEFQGTLLLSEQDAAIKAAIDDNEFCSSADSATAPYYAIGNYTAALDGGSPKPENIKPCGVSSVVLTAAGGAGNSATLSPIKNVKMAFDGIADKDQRLRNLSCAIDVNIEYEWMDTSSTNLLLLDSMVDLDIKAVITMIDGVVFTLDNVVGIETSFESVGDYDKNRVVRFSHKGKIINTGFDGIIG